MKKIFSKFEAKNEKLETAGAKETSSSSYGKSFTIGRSTVTVEDVLAEGQLLCLLLIISIGTQFRIAQSVIAIGSGKLLLRLRVDHRHNLPFKCSFCTL